MTRQYLET